MFTGGMSMHIIDSIGNSTVIKPVFMLHEQGCTFAAESYARITNNLGVVNVTCGPGATNTVTGVAGAWIESTPLLVLTGQCKRADLNTDKSLRQYGVQEVPIVDIVRPITKYATIITDPTSIRYELEKAVFHCRQGRPGPVLLDIPVDVQACKIDEETLVGFVPKLANPQIDVSEISEVIKLLNYAKRPVIFAGAGVSISGAKKEFKDLVQKLGIPVLLSWNAMDLLDNDHPLYAGRPGAIGHRAANFTLQNADLVITIGTRLSLLQTGYDFDSFARNAKLVMVDIDKAELNKRNVRPDIKICSDAKEFIENLSSHSDLEVKDHTDWIAQTKLWMKKYPPLNPLWKESEYVNSFYLMDCISKNMTNDDVYIGGRAGTCVDAAIQAFNVKEGQSVFVTKGLSSMGNGLPAAIGGAYATGKKIVCVVGDGGFVMNAQELEVIRRDQLPIKLFVLNNQGYSTMRNTQTNVFGGHLVGCSSDSGLTIGNIRKIAEAYDIKTFEMNTMNDMEKVVMDALAYPGPCIVEVHVDPAQAIEPRQANYRTPDGMMASRPLEDMKPLLPREELEEIMSISRK